MARDNSPKERQRRELERKRARRASYDRILIVTEGIRTEPNYFKEIRRAYRLQTPTSQSFRAHLGPRRCRSSSMPGICLNTVTRARTLPASGLTKSTLSSTGTSMKAITRRSTALISSMGPYAMI